MKLCATIRLDYEYYLLISFIFRLPKLLKPKYSANFKLRHLRA